MNEKDLPKILYFIEKEILNSSNEDLEVYAQESGAKNVTEMANGIRRKIEKRRLALKKERLKVARSDLDIKIASKSKTIFKGKIEASKKYLNEILLSFPEIKPALTFQNRSIESLTEEDLKIAFEQLEELGVLDDYLEKIKNEKR